MTVGKEELLVLSEQKGMKEASKDRKTDRLSGENTAYQEKKTTAVMQSGAAFLLGMNVVMMTLMILGKRAEAAPTERGFLPPNSNQYLNHRIQSSKLALPDGTTDRTSAWTITAGVRISSTRGGPDKRSKMLKMIAALEDMQRAFNSTLSSRITIMPRGSIRNSGRKNKVVPVAEGVAKSTTTSPSSVTSTASRSSADAIIPSLTGRNFRKSLPPHNKKTNKRVCFWKYCSQN